MALGDSYRNNSSGVQRKEVFRPTVYGYNFTNIDNDAIDKSRISFSMWKNTIKISISKSTGTDQNGFTVWDKDNQASIYLTAIKAKTFADIIEKFIEDPVKYSGYGVDSGKGLITISNGEELGKPNHWCIIIRTVNKETGKCERTDGYEIKRSNYAIYGYDNDGNYNKDEETFSDTEIYMIISQLRDYAEAANNAIAFSVIDGLSYSHDYTNNLLSKIAGACGVSMNQSSQSKSYFASNNSSHKYGSETSESRSNYEKTEVDFDDF